MSIYNLAEDGSTQFNELTLSERSIYGSSRVGTENPLQVVASFNPGFTAPTEYAYEREVGDKRYELANHLGNVLQVVTDRKLAWTTDSVNVDYYVVDVVSQIDYYPFGMLLPNRNESAPEYRYGFNGMEKDNEIKGDGNSYTTEFRLYDPRVARWLSLDPVMHHEFSPYSAFDNSPIFIADPTGADGEPENRPLNQEINEGAGDRNMAGVYAEVNGMSAMYADVSMTNGNTNQPEMAFPSVIAANNGISLEKLYELNPGLENGRHEIGQGQLIYLSESIEKMNNEVLDLGGRGREVNSTVSHREIPDMELRLRILSISGGEGLEGGYAKIWIDPAKDSEWWESGRRVSDKGFSIGMGAGLSPVAGSAGGGTLKINKEYWKENPTYSMEEFFSGSIATTSEGGILYKYSYLEITKAGEVIATCHINSICFCAGGDRMGGSFNPDLEKPMSESDSIETAKDRSNPAFRAYMDSKKP